MKTLRDVARHAGVSIGLASAVINRSATVSERARDRVAAAIAELGYVPHAGARSLRMGRTGLVGLVLPDITNPHFAGLAHAIEGACDDAGLMLTLSITSDDGEREDRQIRLLRQQRADGLILIPGARSSGEADATSGVFPAATILVDRRLPGLDADAILLDNHGATRNLTAHLLALGHARIGLVSGPRTIELARERLAGYEAAFSDAGVPRPDDLTVDGGFQPETAFAAALALLDRDNPPTALVSSSNHTTLGVLRAAARRGMRCPEDISIVALDDLPSADAFSPRLTVAAQPVQSMGRAAVARLLGRLDGSCTGPGAVFSHSAEMIVRGSTRPCFG